VCVCVCACVRARARTRVCVLYGLWHIPGFYCIAQIVVQIRSNFCQAA
jgi:hypothetical protein